MLRRAVQAVMDLDEERQKLRADLAASAAEVDTLGHSLWSAQTHLEDYTRHAILTQNAQMDQDQPEGQVCISCRVTCHTHMCMFDLLKQP